MNVYSVLSSKSNLLILPPSFSENQNRFNRRKSLTAGKNLIKILVHYLRFKILYFHFRYFYFSFLVEEYVGSNSHISSFHYINSPVSHHGVSRQMEGSYLSQTLAISLNITACSPSRVLRPPIRFTNSDTVIYFLFRKSQSKIFVHLLLLILRTVG